MSLGRRQHLFGLDQRGAQRFLISRWQPRSSSGSATAACRSVGTTTDTASQASPSASTVAKRRQECRAQISAARASFVSKMPVSSAPGSDA